jgi:hypothetical protein
MFGSEALQNIVAEQSKGIEAQANGLFDEMMLGNATDELLLAGYSPASRQTAL